MHKIHFLTCFLTLFTAFLTPVFGQPPIDFFDSNKKLTGLEFHFSNPENPVLAALFDAANLRQEINEFETQLSKAAKITHLVHGFWPSPKSPNSTEKDPTTIFQKAENAREFGPEQRAILLAALLNSAGIPTRTVLFWSEKGKSYWACEAFLAEKNGWTMCDAEDDFIPNDFGRTLSAVELLTALEDEKFVYNAISDSDAKPEFFRKKIKPFLFAFQTSVDCRYGDEKAKNKVDSLLLIRKTTEKSDFLKKIKADEYLQTTTSTLDFYPKPKRR